MRRADKLITTIRRQTENEESSSTQGLSDEEFIQYLNDAQRRLQSIFLTRIPTCTRFDVRDSQQLYQGQRFYNIPADAFYKDTIRIVEISDRDRTSTTVGGSSTTIPGSGAGYWPTYFWPTSYWSTGYWPSSTSSVTTATSGVIIYTDPSRMWRLDRAQLQELSSSLEYTGFPEFYDIANGQVLLDPTMNSDIGTLRLTYPRRLDSLDKRRGTITSVASTGGDYVSITVDVASADLEALADDDYLCINDRDGNVTYYNIPYSAFDQSTGVITLEADVAQTGGSIAIGDYVTLGKYSTTHSKLPDECENYLIAYGMWKIFKRDSSTDASDQLGELTAMEGEQVEAMSRYSRDIQYTVYLDGDC